MKVLIPFLLIANISCVSIQPRSPERMLWVGAATFDVATTSQALSRDAVESNPILGNNPNDLQLVGIKTAGYFVVVGLEALAERANGEPLPGWAKWAIWGSGIALQSWAGAHNLSVARE